MARSVGIIAYGTPEDRLRVEALAKIAKVSASAWLVDRIRAEYKSLFGETSPKEVVRT